MVIRNFSPGHLSQSGKESVRLDSGSPKGQKYIKLSNCCRPKQGRVKLDSSTSPRPASYVSPRPQRSASPRHASYASPRHASSSSPGHASYTLPRPDCSSPPTPVCSLPPSPVCSPPSKSVCSPTPKPVCSLSRLDSRSPSTQIHIRNEICPPPRQENVESDYVHPPVKEYIRVNNYSPPAKEYIRIDNSCPESLEIIRIIDKDSRKKFAESKHAVKPYFTEIKIEPTEDEKCIKQEEEKKCCKQEEEKKTNQPLVEIKYSYQNITEVKKEEKKQDIPEVNIPIVVEEKKTKPAKGKNERKYGPRDEKYDQP